MPPRFVHNCMKWASSFVALLKLTSTVQNVRSPVVFFPCQAVSTEPQAYHTIFLYHYFLPAYTSTDHVKVSWLLIILQYGISDEEPAVLNLGLF